MIKRKCFLIVFFSIFIFSCSQKKNSLSFSGVIENCDAAKLYVSLITPYETILIDSAVIKKGKFNVVIKGVDDTIPSFYRLSLSPLNVINTIARRGENIKLHADASSLVKTYTISGGEAAILSWELDRQLKMWVDTVDTLFLFYEENVEDDSSRAFVEETYTMLLKEHEDYLKRFIAQHPYSMATITAFYQTYNRRRFIDEIENIELLRSICTHLKKYYSQSEDVLFLERRLENLAPLTVEAGEY